MKIRQEDTIVTLEIDMQELGVITHALGRLNTDYELFRQFESFQHRVRNL